MPLPRSGKSLRIRSAQTRNRRLPLRGTGCVLGSANVRFHANMYYVRHIHIALALALAVSAAYAENVVLTPITVLLTKSGKPVRAAGISTCLDYKSLHADDCKRPINATTDARGAALIVVATGTAPPVRYPGMPPSSKDPTQTFWFKVIAGSDSREFDWVAMGFGIANSITLKCELDKVPSEWRGHERRKFHLRPLHCDVLGL